MRLRYRKSFKVAPGVRVNLSKSGVGMSVGARGARLGSGPRGTYTSLGIPGTGIYGIKYHKKKTRASGSQPVLALKPFPIPEQLQKPLSMLAFSGILLGIFLLFVSRWLGAIVILASLVTAGRTANANAMVLYKKANRAVGKGDYEEAARALRDVLEIKPGLVNTKLHLGLLYYSQGEYSKAITYFEDYLQTHVDPGIQFQLAMAYGQKGEPERAIELLQALPADFKQELDYINVLGLLFLEAGRPGLALEALKTGPIRKRQIDDKIALFRYLLGTAYLRMNDKKRALAEFKRVYVYDVNFQDVAEQMAALEN